MQDGNGACLRPDQDWPQRIPLKVIGRLGELRHDMIADLIRAQTGPQGEDESASGTNCKGAFVSYTFWVTLPDAAAELSLREQVTKLPGYVMQL